MEKKKQEAAIKFWKLENSKQVTAKAKNQLYLHKSKIPPQGQYVLRSRF